MIKILSQCLAVSLSFIFLSCEKDITRSIEEELPLKNGIIVESYPSGAQIWLGGKNTGYITPDTVYWVPAGELKVTLKLQLFKDSTVSLVMPKTGMQQLFVDYRGNKTMYGHLYIDSNPRGARVLLDDSVTNLVTPCKLSNLMPGYYRITLQKEEHWDDIYFANVKSVVTTYVDRQLTDSILWVTHNTVRTKIPTDYLTAVAIERGCIKWVGTLDKGLLCYDDKTWTTYDMSNSILPDNKINFIYIGLDNVKWICTDFGLCKIDGTTWTLYNTGNSGIPDNRISSVYSDGNELWVGTFSSGMAVYDGTVWKQLNHQNSYLPSNRISYVRKYGDKVWICTNNGLLKVTDDTTYQVFTSANTTFPSSKTRCGFPTNVVNVVAIDNIGKAWVGCGSDGDDKPGGMGYEKVRYFRCFPGKPSKEVYVIVVDQNNVKWIGSSEYGLSRCRTDDYYEYWTHFRMSSSPIPSDRILSIAIDGNGDKWLASFDGGLVKYKGE